MRPGLLVHGLVCLVASREVRDRGYDRPLEPEPNTYDFELTETERENGWKLEKRCGQDAITGTSRLIYASRFDKLKSLALLFKS